MCFLVAECYWRGLSCLPPCGEKEGWAGVELGTEMTGQEAQEGQKGTNCSLPAVSGPSSWIPEGTLEVKVTLMGWGREPAGAAICGVSAPFTP